VISQQKSSVAMLIYKMESTKQQEYFVIIMMAVPNFISLYLKFLKLKQMICIVVDLIPKSSSFQNIFVVLTVLTWLTP